MEQEIVTAPQVYVCSLWYDSKVLPRRKQHLEEKKSIEHQVISIKYDLEPSIFLV